MSWIYASRTEITLFNPHGGKRKRSSAVGKSPARNILSHVTGHNLVSACYFRGILPYLSSMHASWKTAIQAEELIKVL